MKLSSFHVCLPKVGEKLSGDTVVIREEEGVVLLCVIDALGHGPIAADVADRGRAYLASAPLTRDVLAVTEGLHGALRGTRGAAAMCCLLRDGRVEGCGVGNVELRVVTHHTGPHGAPREGGERRSAVAPDRRPATFAERRSIYAASREPGPRPTTSRVPVILTPGILGVSLNRTRVFEGALAPGARLVIFSDGVSPRIEFDRYEHLAAEEACKTMMERHRREHDDATLLVADLEVVDG